jgi:hypothetical protein
MKEHSGLPVAGYKPQSDEKVALVNSNKEIEERLLRQLDEMAGVYYKHDVSHRWLAIARTHFEEGFMALNRAIFQPSRVKLPEDN